MTCGETSFNSYTFTYQWTVNDLEARLHHPSDLKSPVFSSPPGAQPATQWMLTIPSGDRFSSKRSAPINQSYLSIELQRIVSNTTPITTVTDDIQIERSTLVQVPTSGLVIPKQKYDGEDIWVEANLKPPTFIARKNLKLYNRSLFGTKSQGPTKLPKSTSQSCILTNSGGVNVISFNHFLETSKVRNSESVMFECEIKIWSLDKPIHVSKEPSPLFSEFTNESDFSLSKCMEGAHQNNLFTDVTLIADGKEFKAHKVVLASQSPFFKIRFASRWMDSNGDKVKMTDVSAPVMEAILSYMYTGKVADIEKIAYQLLPVAEEYGLVGLRRMCEEALAKSLTNDSAIDVFIHADVHNALDLKKAAMDFILSNTASVKQSEWWGKLKEDEMYHDLWVELLEHIAEKHSTLSIHTYAYSDKQGQEQELLDSISW